MSHRAQLRARDLGLDQAAVDTRFALLDFGSEDRQRLTAMAPYAVPVAGPFIDDLYQHLGRFPATARLLRDREHIARLKVLQRSYFESLFSGTYDLEYAIHRLTIGLVHHRVRLSPRYYLSTYSRYLAALLPVVIEHADDPSAAAGSLLKLVFFDIGLALDAYTWARDHEAQSQATESEGTFTRETTAEEAFSDRASIRIAVPIEANEIRSRLLFLGIDEDDLAVLRTSLANRPSLLDAPLQAFYDKLQHSPTTAQHFEDAETIPRLIRSLRGYWEQLFEGRVDRAYVSTRVHVGDVHERLGIEPRVYFAGIALQLVALLPELLEVPARVFHVLLGLLFFDATYVLDAYLAARLRKALSNEDYAAHLVRTLPTAVIVVDSTLQVCATNENGLALFGGDGELILGADIGDVVPTQGIREDVRTVLESGKGQKVLLSILGEDTDTQLVRAHILRLPGSPARAAVLLDDLSEVRELTLTARLTQGWVDLIANDLPGVGWQASITTGRIDAIFGRVEETTGQTEREWLAGDSGFAGLMSSVDQDRWAATIEQLREVGGAAHLEHQLHHPDGRTYYLHSSIHIADVEDATVLRGISVDVREQALLRVELNRRLAREQELLELAKVGWQIEDPDELCLECCRTLRSLAEADVAFAMWRKPGHPWTVSCLAGSDVMPSALEATGVALVGQRVTANEIPFLPQLGLATAVLSSFFDQEGQQWCLSVGWRDGNHHGTDAIEWCEAVGRLMLAWRHRLTMERARLEAYRTESLGRLAAGVAHDLSNVLAMILGTADAISVESNAGPRAEMLLDNLREAVATGSDLVKQVLAFARTGEVPQESLDLSKAIAGSMRLINSARWPNVELEMKLADGLSVRATPAQIGQLVLNLCSNALAALSDGRGRLEVTLHREVIGEPRTLLSGELPRGEYAVLGVADTGSGIDREVSTRILEPFFTTKRASGGTGLGLTNVHRITTELGGGVDLHSDPGQGSHFEVYLPLSAKVERAQAKAIASPTPGREIRVLLVEDVPGLLKAIERGLAALGFSVIACPSAEEAWAHFARDPQAIDVLVADYMLAGSDGLSLAKRIREQQDVPVLIVSGLVSQIPDNLPYVDRRLSKPVPLMTIANHIRELVGARASTDD